MYCIFKKLVFVVIVILGFASCVKENKSNVLIVQIPSEPEDLHPTNGGSAIRNELFLYTQLSLLKTNYQTGELTPCVALRLPDISKDGLTYVYEIDTNLTWDNKAPILAKDVAFTAKANACILTNNIGTKGNWDNIKHIEYNTQTPFELSVIMKSPSVYNTWLWVDCPILEENFFDKNNILSKYSIENLRDSSFIASHPDITKWANDFNDVKYYSNPLYMNGAGVYKIAKWDKGISITLEKKKNHWSENMRYANWDKAGSDKIIFKINSNNASTVLELKSGAVDVSTYLDYNSYFELEKDAAFNKTHTVKLADTYNYTYLAMNTKPDGKKHPNLFDDIRVREAMALIIPYNQINNMLFNGKSKRALSPVSIFKKDFNTNLKPIETNINKAKILLKQAGWEDTDNDQVLDKIINGKKVPFHFNINFMNNQKQWEDMTKQIAENLQKANISAFLNPLDYNGLVGSAMNHDFDMMLSAWQTSLQPEDFSTLWHTNSWKNNGFNFTGFGNNDTDALIDSINKSINDETRIILSKRLQEKIVMEQPYIFLFSQVRRVVVNKKWGGLTIYHEYPNVLLNTLYPLPN